MRRHTTKQPSGAATTASPRPASRARNRNGSVTSVPLAGSGVGGGWSRPGCQIVSVVVVMVIEAKGTRRLRTEQARILGMLGHRLRYAGAAYMPVEADDAIALRHHHVQIVRHQQHPEPALRAEPADQGIELRL